MLDLWTRFLGRKGRPTVAGGGAATLFVAAEPPEIVPQMFRAPAGRKNAWENRAARYDRFRPVGALSQTALLRGLARRPAFAKRLRRARSLRPRLPSVRPIGAEDTRRHCQWLGRTCPTPNWVGARRPEGSKAFSRGQASPRAPPPVGARIKAPTGRKMPTVCPARCRPVGAQEESGGAALRGPRPQTPRPCPRLYPSAPWGHQGSPPESGDFFTPLRLSGVIIPIRS